MATTTQKIWWTIVGFGPCDYREIVSVDRDKVSQSLAEDVDPSNGGPTSWTAANTRIYGYRTRRQARAAAISDEIGRRGRIA